MKVVNTYMVRIQGHWHQMQEAQGPKEGDAPVYFIPRLHAFVNEALVGHEVITEGEALKLIATTVAYLKN